jgi:hypothetical protein
MKAAELLKQLKFERYRNSHGRVIPIHHAFRTVKLNSFSRTSAVVLPVFFLALVWLFLPMIFDLWGGIFSFWMTHIYHGDIASEPQVIFGQNIYLPYPALEAEMPTKPLVILNFLGCFVIFAVSLLLPKKTMPLNYLLRTIIVIQATASINRLVSPDFFPYTLKIYMLDSLTLCVYMLMLLPPLLGLVYYIFDYPVWRKILLTILMLGYFLVFIPCQYMLHAYLIHEYTMIVLPVLYIFFGMLLDVLTFVSIYAYGMSWRSRRNAMQGRGA